MTADRVRVLTRKWPDDPHWEFDTVRLGEDEFGRWVGLLEGTWMARPGVGMHATAPHVVLLPHDAWWVATFYGDHAGRPFDTYVDITTPVVWSDDLAEARCVDLDLDVIKGTTGRVWVDDEDEFAEHRVTLDYPDDVVAQALTSCAAMHEAVRDATGPFAGAHLRWLEQVPDSR